MNVGVKIRCASTTSDSRSRKSVKIADDILCLTNVLDTRKPGMHAVF